MGFRETEVGRVCSSAKDKDATSIGKIIIEEEGEEQEQVQAEEEQKQEQVQEGRVLQTFSKSRKMSLSSRRT